MDVFYSESPLWYEKIGKIHALLERVKISEEQHGDVLRLRKLNRIMSIHASTAIEGNRLSLRQVQDVINGVPVFGPPKDIKEVQNAWVAYNDMERFDPWSAASLLKAHALMTNDLIGESGAFRTVGVAVVRGDGAVLHRGSEPSKVPLLVDELLKWGKESEVHPLIKSSALHFMIEYIHPFRDGNGRMGRLWQTLVLSRWNPLFAWMPMETLIHYNQALYYQALQDSHDNKVDCRPFIDFMLNSIENSLYKYVDVASETKDGNSIVLETLPLSPDDPVNDPVNDLVNDPVNDFDPVNDPVNDSDPEKSLLVCIKANPYYNYQQLAEKTGKSTATVKRLIQKLKAAGLIHRIGSDKNGHWEVL